MIRTLAGLVLLLATGSTAPALNCQAHVNAVIASMSEAEIERHLCTLTGQLLRSRSCNLPIDDACTRAATRYWNALSERRGHKTQVQCPGPQPPC